MDEDKTKLKAREVISTLNRRISLLFGNLVLGGKFGQSWVLSGNPSWPMTRADNNNKRRPVLPLFFHSDDWFSLRLRCVMVSLSLFSTVVSFSAVIFVLTFFYQLHSSVIFIVIVMMIVKNCLHHTIIHRCNVVNLLCNTWSRSSLESYRVTTVHYACTFLGLSVKIERRE